MGQIAYTSLFEIDQVNSLDPSIYHPQHNITSNTHAPSAINTATRKACASNHPLSSNTPRCCGHSHREEITRISVGPHPFVPRSWIATPYLMNSSTVSDDTSSTASLIEGWLYSWSDRLQLAIARRVSSFFCYALSKWALGSRARSSRYIYPPCYLALQQCELRLRLAYYLLAIDAGERGGLMLVYAALFHCWGLGLSWVMCLRCTWW